VIIFYLEEYLRIKIIKKNKISIDVWLCYGYMVRVCAKTSSARCRSGVEWLHKGRRVCATGPPQEEKRVPTTPLQTYLDSYLAPHATEYLFEKVWQFGLSAISLREDYVTDIRRQK